jgi:hypothetical protein
MIGDGSNIKVMHDPWLRKEEGCWVGAPQSQGVYDFNVQTIMLPSGKKWDHEKINSLFIGAEAEAIVDVPLIDGIHENCLI